MDDCETESAGELPDDVQRGGMGWIDTREQREFVRAQRVLPPFDSRRRSFHGAPIQGQPAQALRQQVQGQPAGLVTRGEADAFLACVSRVAAGKATMGDRTYMAGGELPQEQPTDLGTRGREE